MRKILLFLFLFVFFSGVLGYIFLNDRRVPVEKIRPTITVTPRPSPTQSAVLPSIPTAKLLQNDYQIFQTFNNCGPASLSMALSYFGINKTQAELGQDLRPYQNPEGDNDDKSVTLEELGKEVRKFQLGYYSRPHGSIELLKAFIAQGLPVIIETTLTKDDDIGHFRVVKGYDDSQRVIVQDDSMQGHNIKFSYDDLNSIWKQYDYAYLVLFPQDKQKVVETVLGKDLDLKTAWQEAADVNRKSLVQNPNDMVSRFNLSVALYYLGEYKQSVAEFEKIENQLPFRTLWYQIEPIESYYALGDYQRVFALTDNILNHGNRAFSELYILRGNIYKKQGNLQAARGEFEKAVLYNKNMIEAQQDLQSVTPK